jgi:CHAT domain-containing protein
MRVIALMLVLLVNFPQLTHAADKPPYERLLQGEDKKQAAALEKQIMTAWAAAKFAEAITPAEQALALRRRVQGADHWLTGDAERMLETLRLAARLPAEQQRQLAELPGIQAKAVNLERRGRYAEAEPLKRQILTVNQNTLGEAHPDTAMSYNNVALNLYLQGKYPEAESLHLRALAIWQQVLGEDHPFTAASYNNVATNLYLQGKYTEAEPFFRRALAIRQKVLGEEVADTATSYNNLAADFNAQGRYAEAEPLLRRALALWQKILGENHPETVRSYNNVAANLNEQGKYAEAEPLLRQALARCQRALGEDHPDTAVSYNNVAANLQSQGKFVEAEPLYRRALAIWQQVLGEDHPNTAKSYINVASNLYQQHKYADAEPLFHRALAIYQKVLGQEHPDTARTYSGVAANLDAQGKYTEAESLFRRALAICQKVLGERHPATATSYNNVAANLNAQGKYTEAEPLYRRALTLQQQVLGEDHPSTVLSYNNLAYNLYAQGKYAEAEPFFRRAATGIESARLRSAGTGFERAQAMRLAPHLDWAACLAQLQRPVDAWRAAERGLGRGLLDDLAAPLVSSAPTGEQARQRQRTVQRLAELDRVLLPLVSAVTLDQTQATRRAELLAERQRLDQQLGREVAAEANRNIFPLERIQQRLLPDTAVVFWLDLATPLPVADASACHWACLIRSSGTPIWERLRPSAPKQRWTEADEQLPQRLRQALAQAAPEWSELASLLAAQRLRPLEPHLGAAGGLPAVTKLIVVPIGPMAGVPVELLCPNDQVSYIPSATVWTRLAEAHRPLAGGRLLALGDPAFQDAPTPPPAALPDHGLLLVQVLPGSNAFSAGLRTGDVILSYAGTLLRTGGDLHIKESGDPVSIQVWRGGVTSEHMLSPGKLGVVIHAKPALVALREERDLQLLLASTRGRTTKPLPGTRYEVHALAELLPAGQAGVLLGSQASEQELDRLAAAGLLHQFRLLHFATHGVIDPVSSSRSALLVANDRLPDDLEQARKGLKVYTGRLTTETMAQWQLDADLVTLSACETALGKDAGGEGLLGFSQVLFARGARSLVLSRWHVDDTATALFMQRFYQNLLGKRAGLKAPLGRAAALREAQHWLRDLPRAEAETAAGQLSGGEVRGSVSRLKPLAPPRVQLTSDRPYAHPYYWSAFMLLGDPD